MIDITMIIVDKKNDTVEFYENSFVKTSRCYDSIIEIIL